MAADRDQTIVIKKIKKGGAAGHHGGAWKVAYADFVTAMMAFFLLMWLINTTTPEQKRGIADYFAPQSIAQTVSGSGGVLGGKVMGEDSAHAGGAQSVMQKQSPVACGVVSALEFKLRRPPRRSVIVVGQRLAEPGDIDVRFASHQAGELVAPPIRTVDQRRIEGLAGFELGAGVMDDEVAGEGSGRVVRIGVTHTLAHRSADRALGDTVCLQIESELGAGDAERLRSGQQIAKRLRQRRRRIIDLADALDEAQQAARLLDRRSRKREMRRIELASLAHGIRSSKISLRVQIDMVEVDGIAVQS